MRVLIGHALNRALLFGTVVARLVGSLVISIVLAKSLSPHEFGYISTLITYSLLFTFIVDCGLSVKLLRDVAEKPTLIRGLLSGALQIKMALSALPIAGAAIVLFSTGSHPALAISALALFSSSLLAGLADTALMSYRASERYKEEFAVTAISTVFQIVVLVLSRPDKYGVLVVGPSLLASRIVYLIVVLFFLKRDIDLNKIFSLPRLDEVRGAFRATRSWAADNALGYVNGQFDVLVVAALYGLHSAGVYQLANRFVQGAFALIAVLAGVHLPRLSRSFSRKSAAVAILEFGVVGVSLGALFALGGGWFTRLVFGAQYEAAVDLWLPFGLFVAIRYLASAFGAILAARGFARMRVFGQVAGLLVACVGVSLPVVRGDLRTLPIVMAISSLTVCIVYASSIGRPARYSSKPE